MYIYKDLIYGCERKVILEYYILLHNSPDSLESCTSFYQTLLPPGYLDV